MDLTILRIYMPLAAKVKNSDASFWRKIFGESLPGYLLKKAREFGIAQGVFQHIRGGYLEGKRLAYEGSEVSPPELPQCVELIDTASKLKSFVEKFSDQLKECNVVLFQGISLGTQHDAS
jgi:PII-like signaling protein